jgi:hypothetical protein
VNSNRSSPTPPTAFPLLPSPPKLRVKIIRGITVVFMALTAVGAGAGVLEMLMATNLSASGMGLA